jgi:hypothetical protein
MILHDGGGIVLMHDVKPITAKIINDVLDDLEAENCRRLGAKEEPIWPVSLHYFLRDDARTARSIPADVTKRTDAYKAALPARCAKRPKPAIGDFGAPSEKDRPKGVHTSGECLANPLLKGCS